MDNDFTRLISLPIRNVLATFTLLQSIRWSPTSEATRELVQAIVMCRLDYCNSLLAGIANVRLQRLQPVQNAAACLVSGTRPHDHITRVLVNFHWLPLRMRVIFKTALLVEVHTW